MGSPPSLFVIFLCVHLVSHQALFDADEVGYFLSRVFAWLVFNGLLLMKLDVALKHIRNSNDTI